MVFTICSCHLEFKERPKMKIYSIAKNKNQTKYLMIALDVQRDLIHRIKILASKHVCAMVMVS